MQGREIDFEKLIRQNELSPAIGNMRVNARGDELGPGGKIIRSREEIVGEYYENSINTVPKKAPVVKKEVEPELEEFEEVDEVILNKSKKNIQRGLNES
jgi:hypothetical protein